MVMVNSTGGLFLLPAKEPKKNPKRNLNQSTMSYFGKPISIPMEILIPVFGTSKSETVKMDGVTRRINTTPKTTR